MMLRAFFPVAIFLSGIAPSQPASAQPDNNLDDLSGPNSAEANPPPIRECNYTISTPGSYLLGANLSECQDAAIEIVSSDVSVDLNGKSITCRDDDRATDIGIYAHPAIIGASALTNLRVSNGQIAGCHFGILFASVDSSQVDQMLLQYNIPDENIPGSGSGLVTLNSNMNRIHQNVLERNRFGMILAPLPDLPLRAEDIEGALTAIDTIAAEGGRENSALGPGDLDTDTQDPTTTGERSRPVSSGSNFNITSQNSVRYNNIGIRLIQSGGNRIFGNTVTNNRREFVTTSFQYGEGIWIQFNSHSNDVFENKVEMNEDVGISITLLSRDNHVMDNIVVENDIYGIGAFSPLPDDNGALIPKNNEFYRNVVERNGFADLVEMQLIATGETPSQREQIYPKCSNKWHLDNIEMRNTFATSHLPSDCQ